MPVVVPIIAGATLITAPFLYQKVSEASDSLRTFRKNNFGNKNNEEELVAENNLNEKEGGQRNFGDNYKEQELYYASDEYKKTLQPYEKSISGNKVNSDNAGKEKKLTGPNDDEQRRKLLEKRRLGRYQTRTRSGVLRYPLEALTEHTDYLQIDIEKYEPIGDTYTTAPGSSKDM